jgi:hypothetical protein
MVQSGRSGVPFPERYLHFSNLPHPYSRNIALGLTEPLTETSTRNLPGGKARPARDADNLTSICPPIV